MQTQEIFQRNLARIRKKNPALAQRLVETELTEIEIGEGPRGAPTVTHRGMRLASAYDPVAEGERLAEQMSEEPADIRIALGFALGHHLEAYRAAHPGPIIVYEPSLQRLRAALSVRAGLTLLSAKEVEITTDLEHLLGEVTRYYTAGVKLAVFPHPTLMGMDRDKVVEAVGRMRRAKEAEDITAVTKVHKSANWAMLTAEHADWIRRTPNLSCLYDAFPGVPAVIAAAGPSLNKQLPLLKRYEERVLIVAIGQSLGALREAGIRPHLVHILESQDVSQQIERGGDPREVNLVVTPDTNTRLFEAPVRCRFLATPSFSGIGQWLCRPLGVRRWTAGGGTVAQGAVGVALALGARPIMLIGQDLAFTGNKVYADGSAYDCVGLELSDDRQKIVLKNSIAKGKLLGVDQREDDVEKSILWVEGWDGEKVPTCYSYATFIEHYRSIGPNLQRQGVELVNCTEGGAYIPTLAHRTFAEALEEYAREPVHPSEKILRAHDDWEVADSEVYRDPLRKARQTLDRVEREAKRGLAESARAERELPLARAPKRQIDILRRVGRAERRVRTQLTGTTWLDQLVQPEILAARAQYRKAEATLPTPEQAIEESLHLFRSTLSGVESGRALFERIEESLTEGDPLKRLHEPSEGGRAAAAPSPGE